MAKIWAWSETMECFPIYKNEMKWNEDLKIELLIYHMVNRNQQLKECKAIWFLKLTIDDLFLFIIKSKHLDFTYWNALIEKM